MKGKLVYFYSLIYLTTVECTVWMCLTMVGDRVDFVMYPVLQLA